MSISTPPLLAPFSFPLSHSRPTYAGLFFHSGSPPDPLLPNHAHPSLHPSLSLPASLPPCRSMAGSEALIFGGPSIDMGCLWLGCLVWFISVTLVMVWCWGCTHVHIMTQWERVERRGWSGEVSIGPSLSLPSLPSSPYFPVSLSISFSLNVQPWQFGHNLKWLCVLKKWLFNPKCSLGC